MAVLMGILLLTLVLFPLTDHLARAFPSLSGPATFAPLSLLIVLSSAFAVWSTTHHRTLIILAGALILLLAVLSSLLLHDTLISAHLFLQTLFMIYVTAEIIRVVFRAADVDANILCGAACIYLLIGLSFGFLYALLDRLMGTGFIATSAGVHIPETSFWYEPGWLVYFSFSTLTTVGFGDIVPAAAWSRSLAILEAIVGQIFLVIIIARLVGLHVARTAGR